MKSSVRSFEGGLQVLRRSLLHLGFSMRRIQDYVDAIRREEFAPGPERRSRPRFLQRLAATDLDLEWIPVADAQPDCRPLHCRNQSAPPTPVSRSSRSQDTARSPARHHRSFVLAAGDEIAVIGSSAQIDRTRPPCQSTLRRDQSPG